MGIFRFQTGQYFKKKNALLTQTLSMTIRLRANVLLHDVYAGGHTMFMTLRYPLNNSAVI